MPQPCLAQRPLMALLGWSWTVITSDTAHLSTSCLCAGATAGLPLLPVKNSDVNSRLDYHGHPAANAGPFGGKSNNVSPDCPPLRSYMRQPACNVTTRASRSSRLQKQGIFQHCAARRLIKDQCIAILPLPM